MTPSDAECLSITAFHCNDVIGPEDRLSSLLLFIVIPRTAQSNRITTQCQCSEAIAHAMNKSDRVQAKRIINARLIHNLVVNKPKDMNKLASLPTGSKQVV